MCWGGGGTNTAILCGPSSPMKKQQQQQHRATRDILSLSLYLLYPNRFQFLVSLQILKPCPVAAGQECTDLDRVGNRPHRRRPVILAQHAARQPGSDDHAHAADAHHQGDGLGPRRHQEHHDQGRQRGAAQRRGGLDRQPRVPGGVSRLFTSEQERSHDNSGRRQTRERERERWLTTVCNECFLLSVRLFFYFQLRALSLIPPSS